MICDLCPHSCDIKEGNLGFCKARRNVDNKILCDNYGKITAIAIDPIEKKPLKRFYPGTSILSVGSYGCNMRCAYCQNYRISMSRDIESFFMKPEELVNTALDMKKHGNIGIAFTYNEPLIGYEYVYDTSILAKDKGLKIVLVTNGMINEKPLEKLLKYVDALNIDLKGFDPEYYKSLGGNLSTVKNTISLANHYCHIELSALIIPGENDGMGNMEEMSYWISTVDRNIPLHINRFFPCYKYLQAKPTPVETLLKLKNIANNHLKYVYTGNY